MIISLNLSSYIFINSPFKITLRNNKKIRVKTFLWVKNFWRLKKVCGLNTLRVISSLFSVLNTLRVHKFTLRNECKKCSMLAICFRIYWDLTVLVLSFHISCDVKFLIFFFENVLNSFYQRRWGIRCHNTAAYQYKRPYQHSIGGPHFGRDTEIVRDSLRNTGVPHGELRFRAWVQPGYSACQTRIRMRKKIFARKEQRFRQVQTPADRHTFSG